MPNLEQLTIHLHVEFKDIDSLDNLGVDWSELDSFLATSGSSAKVIDLRISMKRSDHDVKPYLMVYGNICRMVEQNALIITSPFHECDCCII